METSFQEFIDQMSSIILSRPDEDAILDSGMTLLKQLIKSDDWLPFEATVPKSDGYAQYLLYCDSSELFSVVSFVWGPGQRTPVHNHTVWGLIGVIRGAELCEEYVEVSGIPVATGKSHILGVGDVDIVSPKVGDWHRVSNAMPDKASVSIHVYGADIGKIQRQMLNECGKLASFTSAYSNF